MSVATIASFALPVCRLPAPVLLSLLATLTPVSALVGCRESPPITSGCTRQAAGPMGSMPVQRAGHSSDQSSLLLYRERSLPPRSSVLQVGFPEKRWPVTPAQTSVKD